MAKKKSVDQAAYTSAGEHSAMRSELVDATDRAAATAGAALLDVQLERRLRA